MLNMSLRQVTRGPSLTIAFYVLSEPFRDLQSDIETKMASEPHPQCTFQTEYPNTAALVTTKACQEHAPQNEDKINT